MQFADGERTPDYANFPQITFQKSLLQSRLLCCVPGTMIMPRIMGLGGISALLSPHPLL
jgi:hypothetical protein